MLLRRETRPGRDARRGGDFGAKFWVRGGFDGVRGKLKRLAGFGSEAKTRNRGPVGGFGADPAMWGLAKITFVPETKERGLVK